MLVFTFITLQVSTSESRPAPDENERSEIDYAKLNCYLRHLKSFNKLDANYPEYDASNDDPLDCTTFVENAEDVIYGVAIENLRRNPNLAEFETCVRDRLKSVSWAVNSLVVIKS